MELAGRMKKGEAVPLISRLSDHLPVGLDFIQKPTKATGPSDIPAWVEDVPGFLEAVEKAFGKEERGSCPFRDLARWKKAVRTKYKELIAGKKDVGEAYGGQARKLTEAIVLFRLATRKRPDVPQIEAIMSESASLKGMMCRSEGTRDNRYDVKKLESMIADLYGEGIRETAIHWIARWSWESCRGWTRFCPGAPKKADFCQIPKTGCQATGPGWRLCALLQGGRPPP